MRQARVAAAAFVFITAFAESGRAQHAGTYTLDGATGTLALPPRRPRFRWMPGRVGCPRYVIRGAYFQFEATSGPVQSVHVWLLVPDDGPSAGGDGAFSLTPRCPGAALRVVMDNGSARVRSGRIRFRVRGRFRTMRGTFTGELRATLIAPDGTARAFQAELSLPLSAAGGM